MSHPVDCRATLEETGPCRRVWRLSGITSATVEWKLEPRGPGGIFRVERVLVNGVVVYLEPRLLPGSTALIYFDLPSSEAVLPTRIGRCLGGNAVAALSLSIVKTPLHVGGDPKLLFSPHRLPRPVRIPAAVLHGPPAAGGAGRPPARDASDPGRVRTAGERDGATFREEG